MKTKTIKKSDLEKRRGLPNEVAAAKERGRALMKQAKAHAIATVQYRKVNKMGLSPADRQAEQVRQVTTHAPRQDPTGWVATSKS